MTHILSKSVLNASYVHDRTVCLICVSVLLRSICDNRMRLRCCGWIRYFPIECVIPIYLSKLINQVVVVLVPYHNKLWVLCLDCTRGYIQFDMLVAIFSVRNNETCLL